MFSRKLLIFAGVLSFLLALGFGQAFAGEGTECWEVEGDTVCNAPEADPDRVFYIADPEDMGEIVVDQVGVYAVFRMQNALVPNCTLYAIKAWYPFPEVIRLIDNNTDPAQGPIDLHPGDCVYKRKKNWFSNQGITAVSAPSSGIPPISQSQICGGSCGGGSILQVGPQLGELGVRTSTGTQEGGIESSVSRESSGTQTTTSPLKQ